MSGRHKRAAVSPSRRVADVSGKNLSKVSQMAGFKVHSGVAAIVADDNNLSTLAGIAQYSSLVQLSVRASSLVRMAEVASLPCLVTLNLQHNSITEIAGLGGLVNLQWLCLAGNSIKEMSGLSRNVELSHLDLSDNCISHLADLSILPQLKTVLLHGNAVSTLRRLPQCLPQSVETLTLAENEVADLNEVSFLAALQSLTQLSVMSNPCVTLADSDSTVLFDYRAYVLYWCPTLSTLDGVGVSTQERQQAASLFPPSHGCPFSLGQHSALVAHLSSSSSSSSLPLSHLLLWPPQQPLPLSEQRTSEPSPAPLQPASPQEQAELSKKLKALQLLQEMIEAQEELLLNASQSEGEPQPTGGGEGGSVDATAASLPAMQGLDVLSLQVAAAESLDGQARRGGSQEWQEKQKRKEEERAERGEGNRGDSGKLSRLEGDKSLQERRKEQLKLINQKIAANKKHSSTVPSHNSAPSVTTTASFGWEGSPLIARSKTDSQMTKQSAVKNLARDSSISPSINANPSTANDTSFFNTTATSPSDALESTSYYLPIEDSDTILTSAITDYDDGDETLLDISSLASSITQAYGISSAGERSQLLSALVGVRGEQFESWSREMALHSEQGRRAERDTELKQAPITATTASLVSPSRNENVRYPSCNSATKRPITSSNESPSAIASYQPPQAPIDSSVPPPPPPPSAIANQQKATPQQSPNPGLAAVKTATAAAAATAVVVVVTEKQLSPEAAAVRIQALVRGFLTRRIIKLYLARVRAATTIQAAWRGYVARLRDPVVLEVRGQLSRAKLEAYVASLCLQLQGCRQELAHQVHMTQLQEEALHTMLTEVAALQSWRAGLEEEGRRKAAIVIQKHWKGYRVRKCHSFPSSSSSSSPPPTHRSSQALWALCTSLQQQVQQLQSVLGLVEDEEEGEGVEGCGQLRQRYQRMGFLSPPPHQLHIETPAPISSHHLPVPQGLQMSHHSDSCVLLRWLPVTLPSPLPPPPSSPLLPPPTSSPPPAAAAAASPVLQGYSVLVNGTAEGQIAPDKTKAYIEGLDHTATYRVTVRAIFDTGESNDSNAVMASLTALCRDKQAEAHRDSPTNSKSSSSSSSHDTHTNSPGKDEEKSTTSALPDEKILTPAFSEVAQMKEIEAPVVESSDSEAGGTTASQKPLEGNGDSLGSEFSHTTADEEGGNYEVAQVVKTDYEQTSRVYTLTLSDVEAINKPPQSVKEEEQEEEEHSESGTSNHPEVESENALAQQAADPPATTSESYSTAVTLSQEEAATVSGLALSTTALPQQTTALQPREAHPVFEHSRAFDDVSSSGSLTTQHMPTLMLYLSGEHGPTHNATSMSASRLEGTTTMQNIGTSGQPLRQDLAYFSVYNPAINTPVAAGVTVQLAKEHGKLVPLTVEGRSQSFEQNSQDPVTKQDNQTIDITPYTLTSISSTSVVTSSALIGPSATTSTDSSANKCGLLSDQLPNSNPSLKGPDKSIVAFSSAAETTEKVEVSQAGWNQTQAQGSCSMPTEEALQQEATTVAHTLLTCAASPTTEFVGCNGQQLGSYAGSDPAPGPNTVGEGAVTTVDGGAPTGDTGPTFVTSDPVGIAPKDEPFEGGRGGESATTGVSGGGHFEKAVVSTAEALLSQLESELRTSATS